MKMNYHKIYQQLFISSIVDKWEKEDDNKKKLSDMMSKSKHHMSKVADFAWKNVK